MTQFKPQGFFQRIVFWQKCLISHNVCPSVLLSLTVCVSWLLWPLRCRHVLNAGSAEGQWLALCLNLKTSWPVSSREVFQFFSHITGRVQVASCTPSNLCFSIFALFFIKKIQNKQRSSRRKRVLLSPLSIIWCIWFLLLTVTKKPQFKMTHCFNIGPI